MKKILLKGIIPVALCLIFVSCINQNGSLEEQDANKGRDFSNLEYDVMDKGPVAGGTLRLFSTQPDTLNPLDTRNKYIFEYLNLVYEPLVKIDRDQKPIPSLAGSWDVSSDGLIWTFHLDNNVFWHDGKHFNADDVEFTFDYILNGSQNSFYRGYLSNIVQYSAINHDTFRIILKKPNSFTAEMMCFPIIPRHIFKSSSMAKDKDYFKAIGTGPYELKSYSPEKGIILAACRSWHGIMEQSGIPYIEKIEILIYENIRDELSAFHSGKTDLVHLEGKDYTGYKERSDIVIGEYTSQKFEFAAFNLSAPVFMEKEVRQAIASTVDRDDLVKKVLSGRGVPADIPVIPGVWMNDDTEFTYTRDVEKAKGVLIENGWEMKDGYMRKRIKGADTPLKFEILINSENTARREAASIIAEQLEDAGIIASITEVNWSEMIQRVKSKKYDCALLGCTVPIIPDISGLYSSPYLAAYNPEGGWPVSNISGYYNERVDNYITKIFSENDFGLRGMYFKDVKKILYEDVPYLGLFFHRDGVIYNRGLRGSPGPHTWDSLNNFPQWYMVENWK